MAGERGSGRVGLSKGEGGCAEFTKWTLSLMFSWT